VVIPAWTSLAPDMANVFPASGLIMAA